MIAWAAGHRPYVLGRAAEHGIWTMEDMEALPFRTWYALLERWFCAAHSSALTSEAAVLEYLTVTVPREMEQRYPDPERHGMSPAAQAAQAAAEAMYGGSG